MFHLHLLERSGSTPTERICEPIRIETITAWVEESNRKKRDLEKEAQVDLEKQVSFQCNGHGAEGNKELSRSVERRCCIEEFSFTRSGAVQYVKIFSILSLGMGKVSK